MEKTSMILKSITLVFFLSLCMKPSYGNDDANIVVIANKSSTIQKLSKQDIQYIYTGKMVVIGTDIVPIPLDLSGNSDVKASFYKMLLGASPEKMSAYWARLYFTGQATPPRALSTEDVVLKTIATNRSAIGYAYKSDIVGKDFKVLCELP